MLIITIIAGMKKKKRKMKMNKLQQNNHTVLEVLQLLKMTQRSLITHIKKKVNFATIGDGYFIYSKNDTPKPMLCVHLDTINTITINEPLDDTDFEYDHNLNILAVATDSNISCLGGDDRAGVWIALKVIEHMEATKTFNYDVGFFMDEEIGCKGSLRYGNSLAFKELETTCYIGLDRKSTKGLQEVALYGDDNKELIKVFNDLGYPTDIGSITDAATLSPFKKVACVNVSVGYDNEHSKREVLYINCMEDTLRNIKGLSWSTEPYDNNYDHWYGDFSGGYDKYGYQYEQDYIEELEDDIRIYKEFIESLGYDSKEILKQGEIRC